MAVSIKEEGILLLEPPPDFVMTSTDAAPAATEPEADPEDDMAEEQAEVLKANGPPADIELEKLPRPVSSLNCRQARSYLVKLLRAANGGQNPQYGNPASKPPFWPDYYWPWSKLTDVHTKPRGMEEPLLYSEMMKLAIQRGYKYYGYDPENYWDRQVEEKEPAPVERGTPAPILSHQVENLGLPPRLPRPNSKLNCVQARTVLSKLLRYQQAGNNPVYGHPETRPPWWPDECIRWSDMVDLRGKPPYLPAEMTYTDVLKHAIDKGLKFFGYDAETWVDSAQYTREMNHSLLARRPVVGAGGGEQGAGEGPPRLPVPINKMNCGLARTSLSRLLRFHCGKNPKYGTVHSMPVWWPNDVFEWTALKNLSHRYDGVLGDSYSNCLRLAIMAGYEYYSKDPYTYVDESGEDLPTVAAIKRVKLSVNPQVSNMIRQFDDDIADDPDEEDEEFAEEFGDDDDNDEPEMDIDSEIEMKNDLLSTLQASTASAEVEVKKKKRPPPPLIAIKDLEPDLGVGNRRVVERGVKRKIGGEGAYGPLVSGRAHTLPGTLALLKRCRVEVDRMGLDHIAAEPVSLSGRDLLEIARSRCDTNLFENMRSSFHTGDAFSDVDIVFSDGKLRAHRVVLAAASPQLRAMMLDRAGDTEPVDCLVFPDTTLAEGRLAVAALYTGNVKIVRSSQLSLSSVERCVRTFQEVGLLDNYSIQISPLLPLENFTPTKRHVARAASPCTPPPLHPLARSPSPPPGHTPPEERGHPSGSTTKEQPDAVTSAQHNAEESVETQNMVIQKSPSPVKHESKLVSPNSEQNSNLLNPDKLDTSNKYGVKPLSPKKQESKSISPNKQRSLSPTKQESKSPSPNKHEGGRKDCNKPKFSDISFEDIAAKEAASPEQVISWLQDLGFLCAAPPRCRGCGKATLLQEAAGEADGLAWKCPLSRDKCVPGPVTPSLLREHSIFQFSKHKLLWILKIIICWRENTSLSQCHEETDASIDQIFFWYEKCRQFFGPIADEES